MLPSKNIDMLLDLKLNVPSLEYVTENIKLTMVFAKSFKEFILEGIVEQTVDYSVKDEFIALSQDIIKAKIMGECSWV